MNNKYFHIAILGFILFSDFAFSQTDTAQLRGWWRRTRFTERVRIVMPDVESLEYRFDSLVCVPTYEKYCPPELLNTKFEVRRIESNINDTIIIFVPRKTLQQESKIDVHNSYLWVVGKNAWTPIELDPYGSDCYSTKEVTIVLFWLQKEKFPLIELTTNGPACVPTFLFWFSEKDNCYELIEHQCGG
jgi:hypothetical protein